MILNYKNITQEQKQECIDYYLDNHLLKETAAKFNISKYHLRRLFKEAGVEITRGDYDIDLTYFENIDSADKAYWLGLFYADGYISEYKKRGDKIVTEYKFSIALSGDDGYLVDQYKEDISFTGSTIIIPAKTVIRKTDGKLINKSVQTRVDIYNKKIFNDLVKLGLEPRKSKTCLFPEFMKTNPFIADFIRGYFDGDGWVSKTMEVGIIGSLDFNKEFAKVLNDLSIETTSNLEPRVENMGYIRIRNNSKKKFADFIYYKGVNRFMKRKRNRLKC